MPARCHPGYQPVPFLGVHLESLSPGLLSLQKLPTCSAAGGEPLSFSVCISLCAHCLSYGPLYGRNHSFFFNVSFGFGDLWGLHGCSVTAVLGPRGQNTMQFSGTVTTGLCSRGRDSEKWSSLGAPTASSLQTLPLLSQQRP